jgi:hypothetical protein
MNFHSSSWTRTAYCLAHRTEKLFSKLRRSLFDVSPPPAYPLKLIRPSTIGIVLLSVAGLGSAAGVDMATSNLPVAITSSEGDSSSKRLSFNQDIRPILAKHCLACHGPDAAQVKGDLRLDDRQNALTSGAIKPGHATESELIRRIVSSDPDNQMPPPDKDKGESVSPQELEKLRQWIREGADYEVHWAFVPPRRPALPSVQPHSPADFPIRSGLDALVLADLQRRGIQPAPPAAKERWLRRVTFDLTGLPPTPEEVGRFLSDDSPAAEERVVDDLLARESYGERMANDWLDVARYGDTYGRHEDYDCITWPWRDWVIKAFNDNLPFDQFVLKQMAGDLLPDAAPDWQSLIPTTFNRLNIQTNEAGTNPEEARVTGVADRVKTVGFTFLGLTMDCARCHDHKYDPISTREYYSMAAFFDKIDESGMFPSLCNGIPAPTLTLFQGDDRERHESLLKEIATREAKLQSSLPDAKQRFRQWLLKNQPPTDQPEEPTAWARLWGAKDRPVAPWTNPKDVYSFDDLEDRRNLKNDLDPARMAVAVRNVQRTQREGGGSAIGFKRENLIALNGAGAFSRSDAFTLSLWVRLDQSLQEGVVIHRTRGGLDAGHRGYEISIENDRVVARLAYYWPGNAIGLVDREKLPLGEWVHLALTYDGSSKASGTKLYRNGLLVDAEVLQDSLSRDFRYYKEWGDYDPDKVPDSTIVEHPELSLGGRYLAKSFIHGAMDQVEVYDCALIAPEVSRLAESGQKFAEEEWFDWYLREIDPAWRDARTEIKRLRQEADQLVTRGLELMVMRESHRPRTTRVLKRGEFNHPLEEVQPDTPDCVLPFPEEYPRNRLGFARWLLDERNPLTARVQVNRLWQLFFGTGLVATTENFGTQGELPTHPDLLDWLALEFRESGWDLKKFCRMVVLSSTYRQDSLPCDPKLLQDDPDNRLLARGPRTRLTAEQLRDQALAVSGLLVRQVGGPSVKPYQPEGVWEEGGTQHTYEQDHGEALYRRSLYTFWRRTMPPPTMAVFDAPSREFCQVRRPRTSNPLQALTLLNDPQFFEAARVLAERLVQKFPNSSEVNDEQRCAEAFLLLTNHHAGREDLAPLVELLQEARREYLDSPKIIQTTLKSAGEFPLGTPSTSPSSSTEVAATTILIRALFCYDECTHKL